MSEGGTAAVFACQLVSGPWQRPGTLTAPHGAAAGPLLSAEQGLPKFHTSEEKSAPTGRTSGHFCHSAVQTHSTVLFLLLDLQEQGLIWDALLVSED